MSEFDNIWVFFASLAISFESSLVSFWETWLVLAAAAVSLQGFAFATTIANPPALHDDAGDDDESADGCVNKFVKVVITINWISLLCFHNSSFNTCHGTQMHLDLAGRGNW